MKIRSFALMAQLSVAALVGFAACDDDDDDTGLGPTLPIVGTWSATSLVANGEDLVAGGMTLNATFDDSGVYVFHIVGDLLGLCGGESECNVTGNWTGTESTITINPGEDPTTISYVTTGETLTLTGSLEGVPATIVFEKL